MSGNVIDKNILEKSYNLPISFLNRMKQTLSKEEFVSFLNAYSKPAVRGLRVNKIKINESVLNDIGIIHKENLIPWEPNGYFLTKFQGQLAGKHILQECGAYYMQEPSAMLPVNILKPKTGEKVLDLCAAPGGKSTQISSYLGNEGLIVANEISINRAKVLSRNIERMGTINAVVTCEKANILANMFVGFFDKVLVDAPCSGEGMFRKKPSIMQWWKEEEAIIYSEKQKELLNFAYKMVRPGGVICYSTCTFNPIENEEVVRWFLRKHKNCELKKFKVNFSNKEKILPGILRTYPHTINGEGHFIALIQKNDEGKLEQKIIKDKAKLGKKGDENFTQAVSLFKDFFAPYGADLPKATNLNGDQLYSCTYNNLLKEKVSFLRYGLHLGTIRKNRFIPNHAYAASQQVPPQIIRIDLNEIEVKELLTGQEIENRFQSKGWIIFRYCGIDLTWGKASGNFIKNHYPKGLRRNASFFKDLFSKKEDIDKYS